MLKNKTTILLSVIFVIALLTGAGILIITHNKYFGSGMVVGDGDIAHQLNAGKGFVMNEKLVETVQKEQEKTDTLIDFADVQRPSQENLVPYYHNLPGYAFLLAATYKIFNSERYIWLQIIQMILNAAMIFLIFLIGKMMFSEKVGILSALLFAVWIPEIRLSAAALHDAPIPFFLILSTYFFIRYIKDNKNVFLLPASVSLGLLAYIRSDFLLLPIFWGIVLYFYSRDIKKSIATGVVGLAIIFVMLLPLGISNYVSFGRFEMARTAFWQATWEGFGEFKNPFGAVLDDEVTLKSVQKEFPNVQYGSPEYEDVLKQKTVSALKSDPFWYVTMLPRRLMNMILFKNFNNWGFGIPKVFKLAEPLLMVFAFLGFIIVRKDWRKSLLLASLPIYAILSHLPIYWEPRYILPALFPYLIFASIFIWWILHSMRRLTARMLSPRISDAEILKARVQSKFFSGYGGIIDFSGAPSEIIKNADDIVNHVFDMLGSGKVNLGDKIDWQKDFKSGYSWSNKTLYLDIKYGDKPGVDVKVPWELSRFQYLSLMGEAYRLTADEKYAKEFVAEVSDWIENNPPRYGVNWKCTMDAAIRACNWILGYYFFKGSKEITEEFLKNFLKSLAIHGKHIKSNLEKSRGGLTSNHYLSDIAGLIYLGAFFRDIKMGKEWFDFGVKELKKEMKKQVYEDGCDFEASTCYHRLVLEIFFFCTLLSVINDENFTGENYKEVAENIFGKDYVERLYKMFEAVLYLLKPDGKMPQIGDNDNGRFHIFGLEGNLDMRYLLAFGAIFFNELKSRIKENNLENIRSENFSDAGWYVMRNNKDYCIISCGPNGQNGNGGHGHNDKLSFELCVNGKDAIVDPGTFVYTLNPEQRNKFRSTRHHNTVCVDDAEQNNFIEGNLFSMENNAKARCLKWETGEDKDVFIGEHYGYSPLAHRRMIAFYKKIRKIEITDTFTGEAEHSLEWNFLIKNNNVNFVLDKKIIWSKEETEISGGYGNKVPAQKMVGKYKGKLKEPFTQIITW